MIEVYRLEDLLKKYGIDTNKILSKNNKILDRGEYQDIDRTLDYLINKVGISPRNIEKCPSIMYYAVDNIRENYEFLIRAGINISSIETTLHILNTEHKALQESYYYILNNYGKEYISRTTSILRVPVDRVIAIEKILRDKQLIASAACSWNSVDGIEKIVAVCKKNNIPIIGNVFYRTTDEIEKMVEVCKENNVPITGTVFRRTVDELEEIVEVCKENDIPITGSIFLKIADEIKEIIVVCKKNNIPITGTVFHRTADEIKEIIVVCKENNIPLIGNIFLKTADEIEKIITVCKKNNIPITGGVFNKAADEIKKIIAVCKKNNISITGSVFLKTADEIKKIIEVCKKNNIPITGNVFLKTADEIEKIIAVCKKNSISITGSVFYRTACELEKIVEVCKKNNIPITSSVFQKTVDELEKSIDYVKSTYGNAYLQPLIVNKNVEYLKVVLPYLDSLGVLPFVVKSASILTLSLEEIIERKEYIESIGEELVLSNGRFNSIFGMSRANYKKLVGKTRSI